MNVIGELILSLRNYLSVRKDPIGYARSLGVSVGEDCRFLGINSSTFGSEPYLIRIGDHVTVTGGVRFVTHDGGVWVLRHSFPDLDVIAPISVGSNVFLGLNCIIMPGVEIGDDCVIGAGSVITRNIPSGQVVAGVPGRAIMTIDEYCQKSLERGVSTKRMSYEEKRTFLLDNLVKRSHE